MASQQRFVTFEDEESVSERLSLQLRIARIYLASNRAEQARDLLHSYTLLSQQLYGADHPITQQANALLMK